MSEWAPEFLSDLWFKLLVEAFAAGGVVIWERLTTHRSWPESIALGLFVFALLVFLLERFWKPSLRRRIREWLDSSGYAVQTRRDDNWDFWYVATLGRWDTNIRKPKNDKGKSVSIASVAIVAPELRQGLAAMNAGKRNELLKPITQEMLKYGVSFDLAQLSTTDGVVYVSETISVADDMSENDFTKRILFVNGGSKLLSALLLDVKP